MKRRLAIAAAILFGLPLLLLCAAAIFGATGAGQRFLAAEIVRRVNPLIEGRIALERAAVGLDGVELAGVQVWAPDEAEPAIIAERVFVSPAITAGLLRGRVRVYDAQLEGARVELITPAEGGEPNVARAFAPRSRGGGGGGGGSGEPAAWEVVADRIAIERSALVVGTAGAPPQVEVDGLSLLLAGRVNEDGADGSLMGAAALAAPVRGPAAVELEGALTDGFKRLDVRRFDGRIGGSTIAFAGEADLGALGAEVRDLRARLVPADVPGLVPAWSPTVPLRLSGDARFAGGTLATKLVLVQEAAESGATDAKADADLALVQDAKAGEVAPRSLHIDAEAQPFAGTWKLALRGTALDPHGFDARAPAGAFSLGAALQGAGMDEASGTIELPAIALGTGRAGPLRIDAAWRDERLDLRTLDLAIAGGQLRASGWSGTERADLRFDLDARDVRRLLASARALAAGAGFPLPELPDMRGSARFDGRVHGAFSSPAVAAKVRAGSLHIGDAAITGLQGDVDVSGLPNAPTGHVKAKVEGLDAGGTRVTGLLADLALQGKRVRGELHGSTAAGRLHAGVDFAHENAWQTFRFDRLDLGWPSATWTLREQAVVALDDGVRVDDLSLASDSGATLQADGALRANGRLSLDLVATRLDLGKLPPAIAPAELGLAGSAEVRAKLAGTVARPTGEVHVSLSNAALVGVRGIDVGADLLLDGKKVDVVFGGGQGETAIDAKGHVGWPIDPRVTMDIAANLRGLDLQQVAKLLALQEPLTGKVEATVALAGRVGDPRGTVLVTGTGLSVRGIENARAQLHAELGDAIVLQPGVGLAIGSVGGKITLDARARELIENPERVLDVPMRGTLSAKALDVARITSALGLNPDAEPQAEGEGTRRRRQGLRGSVGVDADLQGTLRTPRGTVKVALVDGWNGRTGPLDAEVMLHATDASSRIEVASRLLGKPFLAGAVDVMTTLERLTDPNAMRRTAIKGEIAARELEVASVAWVLGYRDEAVGKVDGTLKIGGTTGAPEIALDTNVVGLGLAGVPWGDVRVDAAYLTRKLDAGVRLRAKEGGEAELRATVPVDLSVRAMQNGSLAVAAEAPLDVAFVSRALDIAFLEGLSPDLRQAEGLLDGELRLRGALPLPEFEGALALRHGRFGWTGFGEVRDLAVEVELQPDAIRLRKLHGQSSGTIAASGAAVRSGKGQPYAIDLEIQSRRFALTTSDIVRGWLDLDARLTGTAGSDGIDTKLVLSRAEMKLADTPSKAVQDLAPHPDFVIGRGGGTIVRAKPKKARVQGSGDFPVVIAVTSERPITVDGTDVSLEASSDLKVVLLDGSPQLIGFVNVESGHVFVLSRRFEFSRGRVYYTGAEEPGDPRLDVVVQHESQYAAVTVTVGGTVSKPTTSLRSNPPYSEAQIAELLATGRLQGKAGGGGVSGAGGAASALGSMLTTQLKNSIASKLPVDVISFQAGDDETFVEGSRLEAGTYLTDRIYLGYARRFESSGKTNELDRENDNEVRLEYELAPRWSLEVTYGDQNVGGADLIWRKDF